MYHAGRRGALLFFVSTRTINDIDTWDQKSETTIDLPRYMIGDRRFDFRKDYLVGIECVVELNA